MTSVPAPGILVLDFDGVICDSIDECFASSLIAYYTLYRKSRPSRSPASLRVDFARMRPFIRAGADFVLLQQALDCGLEVMDQQGFDALAEKAGKEMMKQFHDLFYRARSELLRKDKDAWLGMNRIYPHVLRAFSRLPVRAPIFILSTKKPRFILEILSFARIRIPAERILECGTEPKTVVTASLRERTGFQRSILVDDQIDHLLGARPDVEVFLAQWGYVKEEWLKPPLRVPVLPPLDFFRLIEREFL